MLTKKCKRREEMRLLRKIGKGGQTNWFFLEVEYA